LSNSASYLIADIGGTNTRIATAGATGTFRNLQTFSNDNLPDLGKALAEAARAAGNPKCAVIAAAGPAEGDTLRLTNRAWSISRAKLEAELGVERLIVVNDFVAMAHSIPALTSDEVLQVGDGTAEANGNALVCGPGTGFGVAALIRHAGDPIAIATEAGHMRLGATNAEEEKIFARLAQAGRSLSVEELLSGRGLKALHRVMTGIDLPAEGVIAAANSGETKAAATVSLFMQVFGRIVGDLTLAFDARGGVYIGSGVGVALSPFFSQAPFRRAFEFHPPYEARLRSIAMFVIVHPFPGLLGALQIARAQSPAGA
jgi:glucokinase